MKNILFYFLLLLTVQLLGQGVAYTDMQPEDFKHKIESEKGIIVDVRTEREFYSGYIKGAKNYNYYSASFKNQLLKLPKDKNIYLYCKTGARSRNTAKFLTSSGYASVYNLSRGLMGWSSKGYSLEKGKMVNTDSNGPDAVSIAQFSNVVKSSKVLLVDFYAPWCIPCRQMMPHVDKIKKEYAGKITVLKINADESKELLQQMSVQSVPLIAIFKNGSAVYHNYGAMSEEQLKAEIEKHLN